jgi:integrase
MLRWATQSAQHSPRYRAERLSIVRGFARYVAARDGQSEVPDTRLLGSGHRRQQPHIYTDKQLRELIGATAQLTPFHPLRPHTHTTLFGLLASTGLRISEALGLQQADVYLEAGILHIRQTKFHKSRLVPMHPTVTRVMRHYAACRDRDSANRSGLFFFVSRQGRPRPYSTVRQVFRRLCNRLRWHSNGVLPRPRIHDLRHGFACRRLLRWYRDGVDVDHAIASLSTYLGHGKVTDTYWYFSGTGGLLAMVGDRFERFARSGKS